MALISNDHDLIDFFSVKGEAIDAKLKRPRHEIRSLPPPEEEEWRERKRVKYIHNYSAFFGQVQQDDYRAQRPSCMDDGEICKSAVVKQNQNKERIQKDINHGKEAEGSSGLQLVCLLLNCASAMAENNQVLAENLLRQLYSKVTITGNSIERVAAHFAEALNAKLKATPTSSLFCNNLVADSKQPDEKETCETQFAALIDFYRVSPFYQFAHLTANQAIIEAFEGHSHLHVIDFDISHGIQWSSLIQSLSERKDVAALRITGFGRDMNVLIATGIRLRGFANSYGLTSFEFHPFLEGSKEISPEILQIKEEETVAVNMVLYLSTLMTNSDHTVIHNRLRDIESLKPAIVAVVEHEASHSPGTFLSRFMESLHYYAALFDSLDECLPLQSAERLRIERFHIGEQIKNSIRDDGDDDMMARRLRETHDKWETWKARLERGGFTQIGLSSRCLSQAKLLLQARQQCNSFEGGGFTVYEKNVRKTLSLAWQDRQLILASAWRCKTC